MMESVNISESVNLSNLYIEILSGSFISKIDETRKAVVSNGGTILKLFVIEALTGAEITELEGIVSAHDPLAISTSSMNDAAFWHKYGDDITDYWRKVKRITAILMPEANSSYPIIDWDNWDSLTDEKRDIMSIYIIAPYDKRVPDVFTESEDYANAKNLLCGAYGAKVEDLKGRMKLSMLIMEEVYLNYVRKDLVTLASSKLFGKDIHEKIKQFETFGNDDFYEWLTNEVGSPYENAGYNESAYFDGDYKAEIKDKLKDIYNGN